MLHDGIAGGNMTERRPQGAGTIARDLSQRAHRRLIGILGLLLPGLLYLLAGLLPTRGLPPWRFLTSMSAYYYTGSVGVFVGVLFALSLFLFTYQGYEGDKADRVLGRLGGAAALRSRFVPNGRSLRRVRDSVVESCDTRGALCFGRCTVCGLHPLFHLVVSEILHCKQA